MKDALPLARKDSLVIKEVENETLVYDLESDQAHCLNDTAAQIWKNCDGRTTVTDISQQLSKGLNAPVDENVVWLAIDQLEKFKLLEAPVAKPAAYSGGMSRRQVVRALGVAAIMLPMVTSIVVPTAAQGGSVLSCDCNNPNDCVAIHGPGHCCNPHDSCKGTPSSKGCIFNPNPPCKI
ncbi:MAG TPA: PqqD family protein [Pyrinomonadaceae bacterium]|nr:PqqD family protein [Pyrinomonadaceae bacterium]